MMEPQQVRTQPEISHATPLTVLAAIQDVLDQCNQAQQERPDPAIAHVIEQLNRIRDAVAQSWPLPAHIKREIDLGPFAARNIEDWNESLAEALEALDYSLQHDGASLERLVQPTAGRNPAPEPAHPGDSMRRRQPWLVPKP